MYFAGFIIKKNIIAIAEVKVFKFDHQEKVSGCIIRRLGIKGRLLILLS